MEYQNTSGRSSITSYEVGKGYIRVSFRDGGTYTYTDASVGQDTVRQMIELAQAGSGLNGFINTTTKDDYDDSHDFE